ncbi:MULTISPECIES: HlyD family efflux transporter periplasmic adaptor subunit [Caproicibacterium]|jgi:hypothetical protein|uniref:Secretion protein HlyD n=1 Tax=Caproicibacterium lactatifermentans TaxID=2666138 RepID=A0A859DUX4_9FIRM|nr:HlyD family efflux transporter periplasmic adaptor subunit [Caproicibacterium lactatifermentans]ARP50174.1 hypothetical protein B6259_04335 [Ruminococcaceae bacterium CPB6]QKN24103.1 secretion protein HlyD [Caproicibacterium lactatifermentans]QKO30829.1 secretion protein HlyD [Caproicibacterium lactatifermentans]
MNKLLVKRILSLAAAAVILLFVGYQIFQASFSHQKTETALYKTVADSITVSGYAIRQESLVTSHTSGVLQYDIPDGGKVDKGGTVARAYSSVADAGVLQKKERMTNEMTALQSLASQGSYVGANADNVDSLLSDQLLRVIKDANDGDADITDSRQQLLNLMNEKQLSSGQITNFSARISALQKQIAALPASSSGTSLGKVTANASGYFSSKTDGYESVFPYQNAKELLPENLSDSVKPKAVPKDVVGKVCSQFNWYFACVVSASNASKFQPDTSVTITFPFASSSEVNATVLRVNQKTKASPAAVILQCNTMNSALANIRHETAKITVHTYKGIQINQKAVHFEKQQQTVQENGKTVTKEKTVEGVYVLYGIKMKFKQITPLYSDGTYIYCYCDPNPDPSKSSTKEQIQLYDEVIIEGKDLRDNKIIE